MTNVHHIRGGVDCRGVPISYPDQSAIDGLERAHHCSLVFRGDAIGEIDKVLEEHPGFVMAHLFR
ncbi:MAG: hypothetical protein AAGC81_17335, partial [Pseudomonadota bacterium]